MFRAADHVQRFPPGYRTGWRLEKHSPPMAARLPDRLNARIDRRFAAILVTLSLAAAVTIVRRAQVKPLWHDEIYTVVGWRLPLITLWTASLPRARPLV